MNIAVAALLLAGVAYVHALPGGPPLGACANIFPVGHTNPPNAVADADNIDNSPFQLDLQGFLDETDPMNPFLRYYPGAQYTRKPVEKHLPLQYTAARAPAVQACGGRAICMVVLLVRQLVA